ncbi:hypothetical protein BJV85_000313 [Clostridium acetobutylicum]|nr:hypothetical protein [Clostridium acetobutylicum]NSA91467.1 hypothetical protein [Clostridium acetobutylicum]NYC92406.1 hypothetical protein [Clostridium acetobutylicum]OOL96595.1 hypothetical protein CLACE_25980 [Clostridium acetobutylicum]OOM06818.1 hypothetical protein CLABU_13610 [Clostridium acetobutylicum]
MYMAKIINEIESLYKCSIIRMNFKSRMVVKYQI